MLEVEHISFAWGRTTILDDVSFAVAPGEITVLAGANGAGKTTLMKVLAGLCVPTSGTVRADRFDVFASPLHFRRVLGYLPESAPIEPDMTVKAYLKFRAQLKGEQTRRIRHRVEEALSLCGLEDVAERRIGALSLGMRKRTALADALLLRPRFLLLDDFLAGLDAYARASAGKILSSVSSFASVLVSGHELDELGCFAAKFLVLKDKRVVGAKTSAGVQTLLGLVPHSAGGAR